MDNKQFNLLLLFPSPIAEINVVEDCSSLSKIIADDEFAPLSGDKSDGEYGVARSKDVKILDAFPREKHLITSYFNSYKNNYLKLTNQEFVMTTSWATKTVPQGYSKYHCHGNSVYSGVFYFDEISGGDLIFESIGLHPKQIMLSNPEEWNELNATNWAIVPTKNTLVFFPSYLYHKIGVNTSSKTRYSLAFNFFPQGSCGGGDSSAFFV